MYNRKKHQQIKDIKKIVLITLLAMVIVPRALSLAHDAVFNEAKADHSAEWYNHLPQNEDRELSVADQIRVIAKKECKKRGLDSYCIEDMLAIAWTESRFNCSVIGDNGASHGCYQIHQGYHPEVSQSQAEDLSFAINWTLNRLVRYGYPVYRSNAIRKHNGSPTNPKTLEYLNIVNNY